MAPRFSSLPRERFPWLLLLVLLATAALFWLLPRRQGPQPVTVEFAGETR